MQTYLPRLADIAAMQKTGICWVCCRPAINQCAGCNRMACNMCFDPATGLCQRCCKNERLKNLKDPMMMQ